MGPVVERRPAQQYKPAGPATAYAEALDQVVHLPALARGPSPFSLEDLLEHLLVQGQGRRTKLFSRRFSSSSCFTFFSSATPIPPNRRFHR